MKAKPTQKRTPRKRVIVKKAAFDAVLEKRIKSKPCEKGMISELWR
jgi:hypothetical protein